MKTVNIKGKEYVQVDERIKAFLEIYQKGMIRTVVINDDGKRVQIKATVYPDYEKQDFFFTGHAEEVRGQGMINTTSAVENCETSAVGRALGMMGIGLIGSIASADEVSNAIKGQESRKEVKAPQTAPKQSTEKPEPITEKQINLMLVLIEKLGGLGIDAGIGKLEVGKMSKTEATAKIKELMDMGEKAKGE